MVDHSALQNWPTTNTDSSQTLNSAPTVVSFSPIRMHGSSSVRKKGNLTSEVRGIQLTDKMKKVKDLMGVYIGTQRHANYSTQ